MAPESIVGVQVLRSRTHHDGPIYYILRLLILCIGSYGFFTVYNHKKKTMQIIGQDYTYICLN